MTKTERACWQDDVCCGNLLHNSRIEVLVTKAQIAKSYQQAKKKKKVLALKIQGLLLLFDYFFFDQMKFNQFSAAVFQNFLLSRSIERSSQP